MCPNYANHYALLVSLLAAIRFCGYVLFHSHRMASRLCIWQPLMVTQKWSPFYWPEGPTLRPLIRWGGRWGSGNNDALLGRRPKMAGWELSLFLRKVLCSCPMWWDLWLRVMGSVFLIYFMQR